MLTLSEYGSSVSSMPSKASRSSTSDSRSATLACQLFLPEGGLPPRVWGRSESQGGDTAGWGSSSSVLHSAELAALRGFVGRGGGTGLRRGMPDSRGPLDDLYRDFLRGTGGGTGGFLGYIRRGAARRVTSAEQVALGRGDVMRCAEALQKLLECSTALRPCAKDFSGLRPKGWGLEPCSVRDSAPEHKIGEGLSTKAWKSLLLKPWACWRRPRE